MVIAAEFGVKIEHIDDSRGHGNAFAFRNDGLLLKIIIDALPYLL